MSKRFKLSFSNVLPSSLRICRSKQLPICPQKPKRPVYGLAPVNPKTVDISFPVTTPPTSTPDNCFMMRDHMRSDFSSSSDYPLWVEEASEKRRGDPIKLIDASRSFDSSCDGDMSPFYGDKKKKAILKDEENLICSSQSFSMEFQVKSSVFKRMMPCTMDGKVRDSIAVVKKSKKPLGDFKRSMLEMILEKQMFDACDLEQLLECFLTLNSTEHHGVIMEAFTEIWELLFSDSFSVE